MKKLLILFFILFHFSVYSQEGTNKKIIRVHEYYEGRQLKEKGKKKWQTKWSSTSSGRKNGHISYFKQGKWIEYYSNGNKKRIIIYDKGEVLKIKKEWNEFEKLILGKWNGEFNFASLKVSDTLVLTKNSTENNCQFHKESNKNGGRLEIDDKKGYYFINKENDTTQIRIRLELRMLVGEIVNLNENQIGIIVQRNTYLD